MKFGFGETTLKRYLLNVVAKMRNIAILRKAICLAVLATLTFSAHAGIPQTGSNTPESILNAVIANAEANGDIKAARRATNLKTALGSLKPSDLNGITCGKDAAANNISVEQQKDIAGKLLDKGLEKYLPSLAAALASAAAAGVVSFLTPERIGSDAVETLNNTSKFNRDDVSNAARQVLQDTIPDAFKKLPKPMMAKIVSCSL